MALTVKTLADGQIGPANNTVYDLYTVPAGKAAIVKNHRYVNIDSAARTVTLYYLRASGTPRTISPVNMSIASGYLAIEQDELTLGAGDKVQGKADVGNKIDFVISGIERDA